MSACETRLDSTLSRWGRKSSSLSSGASGGAACAALSRTGPELIVTRVGVQRSVQGSTALPQTLAEDREPCNKPPPRCRWGTRCSCMVPCKEQAGNRGTWPAVVFYSRGLRSPLEQAPEDLRFPAPGKSAAGHLLPTAKALARGAGVCATKSPRRHSARVAGAVLVSTLFSKILVTRVNRKNATRADCRLLRPRGVVSGPSVSTRWRRIDRARSACPCFAAMNGLNRICGICREIIR